VFLQSIVAPEAYRLLIQNYGLVPAQIMEGKNLISLVTSMFLHLDILHLGINMLFLLLSADAVEREVGNFRFLGLYMAFGIIAGLFHTYMNSASTIPTIGASGAIFGVLAAFAILFPIPMPAILFVFITIITETAYVASGTVENVAHTAHVGGFLAGVFLTLLFVPKNENKRKTSPKKTLLNNDNGNNLRR
jgi:membrane associated rhomboid family serine protease